MGMMMRLTWLMKVVAQGANYISFVGPEKELPQGDTTYGTSITRYKGMDDGNDIIVRRRHTLPPPSGFCPAPNVTPHGPSHHVLHAFCVINSLAVN